MTDKVFVSIPLQSTNGIFLKKKVMCQETLHGGGCSIK